MHTCVNSINNIDGSLADDRFIEALLCNWRHTVITVICTGRIRRPGPARYKSGPARPVTYFLYPGPARGPPGPCRSLDLITRDRDINSALLCVERKLLPQKQNLVFIGFFHFLKTSLWKKSIDQVFKCGRSDRFLLVFESRSLYSRRWHGIY